MKQMEKIVNTTIIVTDFKTPLSAADRERRQ